MTITRMGAVRTGFVGNHVGSRSFGSSRSQSSINDAPVAKLLR